MIVTVRSALCLSGFPGLFANEKCVGVHYVFVALQSFISNEQCVGVHYVFVLVQGFIQMTAMFLSALCICGFSGIHSNGRTRKECIMSMWLYWDIFE